MEPSSASKSWTNQETRNLALWLISPDNRAQTDRLITAYSSREDLAQALRTLMEEKIIQSGQALDGQLSKIEWDQIADELRSYFLR